MESQLFVNVYKDEEEEEEKEGIFDRETFEVLKQRHNGFDDRTCRSLVGLGLPRIVILKNRKEEQKKKKGKKKRARLLIFSLRSTVRRWLVGESLPGP